MHLSLHLPPFWPLLLVPPSSPARSSHPDYRRHPVLFTELLSPSGAVGMTIPPPPAPASSLQRSWDSPRVTLAYRKLLETAPDAPTRARLLAACTKESGAWLQALPVSSLGLRTDKEVVRVAMGLRLGVSLCHPHLCKHCQTQVDHQGLHGLSCRRSQGRHPRHTAINDIIKRSLTSVGVPSHLEPSGICLSDGKRPDGATVIPWKTGRVLVQDATCPDTFAPSHISLATREAGAVAAQAEQRKRMKYAELKASHHFVPVVIETTDVCGPEALQFLCELGHRLKAEQGSHAPFNSSSRGSQLPCRGATQLLFWAQSTTINVI